jgi:hypothetical protein
MDLAVKAAAVAYFATLATVSTTFVGFSALIMSLRQAIGGGYTRLDSWITLIFVQLGFIVTAGALGTSLLALADWPETVVWRVCSSAAALAIGVFAATYPARRHAVARIRAPLYVRFDVGLLGVCVGGLLSNAVGWPWPPNPAGLAAGLTGALFVAGLGYLHALSALHHENRATPPQP